ncbi:hypothetical protein W03_16030 [Nitrosomonas sp. PY1]|uniref:metal-dependent hydrolase n=1 Tax=Nitrosomonas sp. PY1 TaxID=1803906 RepID=UPI001FC8D234|nr:metal-dependent hydrolase [Nitrosomonas sp. PY1]GKS69599.1 hypothetical protein W03_16030 [Nitrosomonas sp. PY1]
MPFTPLHMGAGVALKAVTRNSFSLVVFGGSQIAIDIQPLVVMLTNKGELHGFSHTILGATLIGLFCGLAGKPIGELFLRLIRKPGYLPIDWRVSFGSAFIGTYSHIFIDSIMHSDVTPLSPFSTASPLYGIISIETLHVLCLAGVFVGGLAYWAVEKKCKKT